MAVSTKTANLGLTLPGDASHDAPWGLDDHIIVEAIAAIDDHLSDPVTGASRLDVLEARLAKLEARDAKLAADLAS
jgi:hypothetical protein